MKPRMLERVLWGAALTALALGVVAARRAIPARPAIPTASSGAPRLPARIGQDSLARLAVRITEGNLFRLDRQPAGVAYRPELEGAPPVPPPPKPPLTVAGIVGGPPWAALLDGVPGRDGSVLVRAGDTLATLTVRAVTPTTVTITGLDTTWRLTLKRPWR